MRDLIERLRDDAKISDERSKSWEAYPCHAILMEAADEITKLRAAAKRAIIALEYADVHMSEGSYYRQAAINELRAALSDDKETP